MAMSPCGSYIFAFGRALPGGDFVTRVARYSIETDRWETLETERSSEVVPVVGAVAVTMPDGIYLLGGYESSSG